MFNLDEYIMSSEDLELIAAYVLHTARGNVYKSGSNYVLVADKIKLQFESDYLDIPDLQPYTRKENPQPIASKPNHAVAWLATLAYPGIVKYLDGNHYIFHPTTGIQQVWNTQLERLQQFAAANDWRIRYYLCNQYGQFTWQQDGQYCCYIPNGIKIALKQLPQIPQPEYSSIPVDWLNDYQFIESEYDVDFGIVLEFFPIVDQSKMPKWLTRFAKRQFAKHLIAMSITMPSDTISNAVVIQGLEDSGQPATVYEGCVYATYGFMGKQVFGWDGPTYKSENPVGVTTMYGQPPIELVRHIRLKNLLVNPYQYYYAAPLPTQSIDIGEVAFLHEMLAQQGDDILAAGLWVVLQGQTTLTHRNTRWAELPDLAYKPRIRLNWLLSDKISYFVYRDTPDYYLPVRQKNLAVSHYVAAKYGHHMMSDIYKLVPTIRALLVKSIAHALAYQEFDYESPIF